MRITIVGAGRVGVHLAKYFINERQDVYLIDTDTEKLTALESDFNLKTFVGHPTDFKVLRESKSDKADIFIALTSDTSENLVACAMAKSMGAGKTIARVDKYDFMLSANENVVHKMGVDHIVFPDFLAARTIVSALDHSWCRSWNDFDGGAIVMVAVSVTPNSPIAGLYLRDLNRQSTLMHVAALRRNHSTIIPHGDDIILPGDILYITAVPDGLDIVKQITGKKSFQIKKVLIMGGSMVAEIVAGLAQKKYSIVIMEKNIERCRELAAACPDADIIYGDGSEQDVLDEAGIHKCDAFVAMSDNSESNILACLTSKEAGVPRTIAEVEKEQFITKAESFNIGCIINKPIITANAIFQLIIDANSDSSKCFAMTDAEVARMEIKEDSFLTRSPVKDLRLPHELTLAALIRNGKGEIVTGATHLKKGDKVIVFCLNGVLDKVEKIFGK